MPTTVDSMFDHVNALPLTSRGLSRSRADASTTDFEPEGIDLDRSSLERIDNAERASLADDEARRLDGAVCYVGFEALAFYKSRRYINDGPCRGEWGIFYLQQGIQFIAGLIEAQAKLQVQDGTASAIAFLRAHEIFHYRFDLHTLFVEASRGERIYEKLKEMVRPFRTHQVEEALANRSAWEWAKRNKLGRFAKDFMTSQPDAYARFGEDPVTLSAELAANLHSFDFARGAASNELGPWTGHVPAELWKLWKLDCPEHLVAGPQTSYWLKNFDPTWANTIREIDESPKFSKRLRRYPELNDPWNQAKDQLIGAAVLPPGLDFKPFRADSRNVYSVRLSQKRRAHLRRLGSGRWVAEDIGEHTEMGHG